MWYFNKLTPRLVSDQDEPLQPVAETPELSKTRMAEVEALRAAMSNLAGDETLPLLDRVLCLKLITLRSNLLLDELVNRYSGNE